MGGIKSPWVSDGIKSRSKGHAVYRAHVNREAGQCERCKGLGKIIWGGSENVSKCYSCRGKGVQTDADIDRNAAYNLALDRKIESSQSPEPPRHNDSRARKKTRAPNDDPHYSRSHVLSFADSLRKTQTATERRFASFLDQFDGGRWKGQYKCQHAFTGRWIADFYIPSIRLVIEIDGISHSSAEQLAKDELKTKDALKLDMSIVRFTNDDVWRNIPYVSRILLNEIEEAEFRLLATLSPYGVPYSTHPQKPSPKAGRFVKRDARREWKDLPDYAPKIPGPDDSMSEKYRGMKFSDAAAIPGIELIRQCLNPKCNYQNVMSLEQALKSNLTSSNWTAEGLEERSICSKCHSHFVLVRLGKTT